MGYAIGKVVGQRGDPQSGPATDPRPLSRPQTVPLTSGYYLISADVAAATMPFTDLVAATSSPQLSREASVSKLMLGCHSPVSGPQRRSTTASVVTTQVVRRTPPKPSSATAPRRVRGWRCVDLPAVSHSGATAWISYPNKDVRKCSASWPESLAFFYDLIPNYAVAICLLTLVVLGVLSPITLKGTRSMLAMQKLQPEMKRIQDAHKGDRQAANEAMMAFYKEHKINPIAGCLPMFAQIPVLSGDVPSAQRPRENTRSWTGCKVGNPSYFAHDTELYKALVKQRRQDGVLRR